MKFFQGVSYMTMKAGVGEKCDTYSTVVVVHCGIVSSILRLRVSQICSKNGRGGRGGRKGGGGGHHFHRFSLQGPVSVDANKT